MIDTDAITASMTFSHPDTGLYTQAVTVEGIDRPAGLTEFQPPEPGDVVVTFSPDNSEVLATAPSPPPLEPPPTVDPADAAIVVVSGEVCHGQGYDHETTRVGYFHFSFDLDRNLADIVIDIAAEYRGQGFGSVLLQRIKDVAGQLGITELSHTPTNTDAVDAGIGLGFSTGTVGEQSTLEL